MGATNVEVIVVGAGVSGLSCAAALAAAGAEVLVLDRRKIGGRVVTWRLEDGGRADYGVGFFHGETPAFLGALGAVDAAKLPDWPQRIVGRGTPCQPHAFSPRQQRLAFADGVARFPAHLARGLDLRRQTAVANLELDGDRVKVLSDTGETFTARTVVLALAGPQTVGLLESLSEGSRPAAAMHLLRLAGSQPGLALIASFPRGEELAWDMLLPEESRALLVLSNESTKRPGPSQVLVLHARPAWSRQHLAEEPAVWSRLLLEEAAGRLGDWARAPSFVRPHVWRYARTDRGSELSGPLLLPIGDGGARLGLVGELFGRGAGVEAAWLSGQALAARLGERE